MIRLNLNDQVLWQTHRSGWKYALNGLASLNSEQGVLFDGCLDSTFGFNVLESLKEKKIPYSEQWIGFIHSTINISPWFYDDDLVLRNIITSKEFKSSLKYCKGLFTLSEHVASYLRSNLNIDVVSLKHPTEFPEVTFNLDSFFKEKKVIHVGTWMRKISSFYELDAPRYKKILLLDPLTLNLLGRELNYFNNVNLNLNKVKLSHRLPDTAYDDMLSTSVVFLDLFDSNANNTIIECIARKTPILINRLNSIVEYLGVDYPLYYDSIKEASLLIKDFNKIEMAHHYLADFSGREQLKLNFFIKSFVSSKIIKNLMG